MKRKFLDCTVTPSETQTGKDLGYRTLGIDIAQTSNPSKTYEVLPGPLTEVGDKTGL